jgi:DnaJ-class molecular chaperone
MSTAFEILGLPSDADAQQVRTAYRSCVKTCHPDQFTDLNRQKNAQEQLIQLNLAYEEALKTASQKRVGFNLISLEEAKHFAVKLMEQGNHDSALRQLNRTEVKDAEFFFLQGQILMAMRQYETAHQSYREAIRRDPDNSVYRRQALDAVLAHKRSQRLIHKVIGWVTDILGGK